MSDILKVILFSISSYVVLFTLAKILGKKQIAQLSFIDYVVGISIGSIAAEMATETEEPFYHYLVAMVIFFLFDLVISIIGRKGPFLKKILKGKPTVIVENGKINYNNLKKIKITVDEFIGMARDKNYFDLEKIDYAFMETSGNLSILPKSEYAPLTPSDMKIETTPSKLIEYFVIDGKISKDTLISSGHDEKWLLKGLHVKIRDDLKNIVLASYDQENHNFIVHYKDELTED